MVFHDLDCGQNGGTVGAEALRQSGPLRASGRPYIGVHEPVTDLPGEVRAVMFGDQSMHHVQRSRPAGTCHPVPVDDIEGAFEKETGMTLGESGIVLPVNRHPPVVHDACVGEDSRSAGHTSQHAAVLRLPP